MDFRSTSIQPGVPYQLRDIISAAWVYLRESSWGRGSMLLRPPHWLLSWLISMWRSSGSTLSSSQMTKHFTRPLRDSPDTHFISTACICLYSENPYQEEKIKGNGCLAWHRVTVASPWSHALGECSRESAWWPELSPWGSGQGRGLGDPFLSWQIWLQGLWT